MNCKDCPCGREDYERRLFFHGEDNAEQFHGCKKTGGKVYIFGRCEDAYPEKSLPTNHSKRKRRNKRERDLAYKHHLKVLYEKTCNYYPCPVWYKDEIWVKGYGYVKNPNPYYKRMYLGNHKENRFAYFKRHSNRQVRRYKGELQNGGAYKKVFDYWYTVI